MSKILITGGCGFLGGALTDILLQSSHELRVYDNLTYEDQYRKDVPFVFGDVRKHFDLKKQLDWADVCINLAGLVGDGACALDPVAATEINYDAVKFIADNFHGRIIQIGTASVYGSQNLLIDELSLTNPLSLYASTKLKAEQALKDKNAMIFRLGTLFGIGDEYSRLRLDLVVNTLTAKAVSEHKLKVFNGNQYRPLLHVKDAAQAIVDNLATAHTGVYNLHKENLKILDLADMVAGEVPGTTIEVVSTKFEDARDYRMDSQKAVDAFGFSPDIRVSSSISDLRDLLESGRIKDLNNPRYTNQGYLSSLSGGGRG